MIPRSARGVAHSLNIVLLDLTSPRSIHRTRRHALRSTRTDTRRSTTPEPLARARERRLSSLSWTRARRTRRSRRAERSLRGLWTARDAASGLGRRFGLRDLALQQIVRKLVFCQEGDFGRLEAKDIFGEVDTALVPFLHVSHRIAHRKMRASSDRKGR